MGQPLIGPQRTALGRFACRVPLPLAPPPCIISASTKRDVGSGSRPVTRFDRCQPDGHRDRAERQPIVWINSRISCETIGIDSAGGRRAASSLEWLYQLVSGEWLGKKCDAARRKRRPANGRVFVAM